MISKEGVRLLASALLEAELNKTGLFTEWQELKKNNPPSFGNDAPLSPHLGKPQKVNRTDISKQQHASNRRRF